MEPAQRVTYSNAGKMALDMLSIPATSALPGGLFSGAGTPITERRNSWEMNQSRHSSASNPSIKRKVLLGLMIKKEELR